MIEQFGQFIEERLPISQEETVLYLNRAAIVFAVFSFLIASTVIVAFDSIFQGFSGTSDLEIGQVANRDIVAPPGGGSYISELLTELNRQDVRASVQPIYSAPELNIARTWSQRAEQTLDFIDDVRAAGRYDTIEQQLADLSQMNYLQLDPENAERILSLGEDTWSTIALEVDDVLERAYRNPIRDGQLQNYIDVQVALQISSQFDTSIGNLVFDIVDDFVRPNTFENIEATQEERDRLEAEVDPVERTFASGQIIVRENDEIEPLDYEALVAFNLIQSDNLRLQQFARAFIASTVTLVIFGLYLARFNPNLLYHDTGNLTLVAVIFLITLALTRLLGINGDIYLFPAAAMALLFVATTGAHTAVISTLGLAFLTGLIANDSMEIATLITAGGIIGTLGLRRAERLNQFFVAGALIGIINAAVVVIFNILSTEALTDSNLVINLFSSFFSGLLLVPATAIAAMYVVTMLFNLPTALKLIDLQQPNKPMLQRLLREAPGTYQHSLQVGNLAEQAANAIGADAQLTHVAALYHDIGKMHNPLYFTENQQDIGNPHDTLNDPYRSADIIISHITEGDEMAKQVGLPQRIRDFIREHHGTTQVYVFYQRALNAADGDETAVDISDFTYPGPNPRSKETAILMLADSCEAAVRSIKPKSKKEIGELVGKIIDGKRSDGQLDESGLTLNDLRMIREIFVDILQGMFHPRINYREAVNPKTEPQDKVPTVSATVGENNADSNGTTLNPNTSRVKQSQPVVEKPKTQTQPIVHKITTVTDELEIADEEPLTEVPRLPSLDERRATTTIKTIKDDDENLEPPSEQKPKVDDV